MYIFYWLKAYISIPRENGLKVLLKIPKNQVMASISTQTETPTPEVGPMTKRTASARTFTKIQAKATLVISSTPRNKDKARTFTPMAKSTRAISRKTRNKASGPSIIRMAHSTKETSRQIKSLGSESWFIKIKMCMKVSGTLDSNMAKANIPLTPEASTLVRGKMVTWTVKVLSPTLMEMSMRATG